MPNKDRYNSDEGLKLWVKEAKENPNLIKEALTNQQNTRAREYQKEAMKSMSSPVAFEAETGFGDEAIDYDLIEGGHVQGDLVYDKKFLDRVRDDKTTFGGDLVRVTGKIGSELLFGTAAGIASLWDMPSAVYHLSKGDFAENYEQNAVSAYLSQVTENFNKLCTIQNGNDNAKFLKWIGEASGSIASTVSILVPGMAFAKVGRMLGKGLNVASKFAKAAKYASKVDKIKDSLKLTEAAKREGLVNILREYGAKENVLKAASEAKSIEEVSAIADAYKSSNQLIAAVGNNKVPQKIESAIATLGSRSVETLMELDGAKEDLKETYRLGGLNKIDLYRNGRISIDDDEDLKLIYDIAYDQYLQKNGMSRFDIEKMDKNQFTMFNEAVDNEAINIMQNFENYDILKRRFGSVANSQMNSIALKNMALSLGEYFQFDKLFSLMKNPALQSAKNSYVKYIVDRGKKILSISASEGFEEAWQTGAALSAKNELIKGLDLPDHLYADDVRDELLSSAIMGAIGGVTVGVVVPYANNLRHRLTDRINGKKTTPKVDADNESDQEIINEAEKQAYTTNKDNNNEIDNSKEANDVEQNEQESRNESEINNNNINDKESNSYSSEVSPINRDIQEQTKDEKQSTIEKELNINNETQNKFDEIKKEETVGENGKISSIVQETIDSLNKLENPNYSFNEILEKTPMSAAISTLLSNISSVVGVSNIDEINEKLDELNANYIDVHEDKQTKDVFSSLINGLKEGISRSYDENIKKGVKNPAFKTLVDSTIDIFNKSINENLNDDFNEVINSAKNKSIDSKVDDNIKNKLKLLESSTKEQIEYSILKTLSKNKILSKYKNAIESKINDLGEQTVVPIDKVDISKYSNDLINDIIVNSVFNELIFNSKEYDKAAENVKDITAVDVVSSAIVNEEISKDEAIETIANSDVNEEVKEQSILDIEGYSFFKESMDRVQLIIDAINNDENIDLSKYENKEELSKAILNSNSKNKVLLSFKYLDGSMSKYINKFYKSFKVDKASKLQEIIQSELERDKNIIKNNPLLDIELLNKENLFNFLESTDTKLIYKGIDVTEIFKETLTKKNSKYKEDFLSLYFGNENNISKNLENILNNYAIPRNNINLRSETVTNEEIQAEIDFSYKPINEVESNDNLSKINKIGLDFNYNGTKYSLIEIGGNITLIESATGNTVELTNDILKSMFPSYTELDNKTGILNILVSINGENKSLSFNVNDNNIVKLFATDPSLLSNLNTETKTIAIDNEEFSDNNKDAYDILQAAFDTYKDQLGAVMFNDKFSITLGDNEFKITPIISNGSISEINIENRNGTISDQIEISKLGNFLKDNNINIDNLYNIQTNELIASFTDLSPSLNIYSNPNIVINKDGGYKYQYDDIFNFWSYVFNNGFNNIPQLIVNDITLNNKFSSEEKEIILGSDMSTVDAYKSKLEEFLSNDENINKLMSIPITLSYKVNGKTHTIGIQQTYQANNGGNIDRSNIRKNILISLWAKRNGKTSKDVIITPTGMSYNKVVLKNENGSNISGEKTKLNELESDVLSFISIVSLPRLMGDQYF